MIKISDDLVNILIILLEDARDNQFKIGDYLIVLVGLHNGDKGSVINYLAGVVAVSAGTLYDYYRIAERWSKEDRVTYQSLDWTIYRNADPVDDKELLDLAIENGWNATTFKEMKYPKISSKGAVIGRLWSWYKKESEGYTPTIRTEIESLLKRLEEIL